MHRKPSSLLTRLHTLRERLKNNTRRWDPRATVGLIAITLVAAGVVAGTTVDDGSAVVIAQAAAVDTQQREQQADRADRSGRTSPLPLAAPSATPTTTTTKAAQPAPAWVNPMPGAPLSSCYGPRWGTQHQGIDLAGESRSRILAVGAGTVIGAGWLYAGYGISVVIDHGNGYLSHYAHAQEVLVNPGQYVKAGQPIALEGSTGDSTGPHLHFEIHQGMWNPIDPAPWLRAHGVEIGC